MSDHIVLQQSVNYKIDLFAKEMNLTDLAYLVIVDDEKSVKQAVSNLKNQYKQFREKHDIHD